ncbi:hypothetical protein BITS_0509 [Bifidobacterium tsurumiense]|uniref:Sensor histidine kinase NatK-like C-terminal domain-containing protein n=2 Tax=Bifidobacterium tsurumiense TaxID=356829 RepID=A0A087EK76_9BIFI|nr:hypothetical protein BITS_0509 [Bifidobacterium tsurumiense]
MLNLPIVTLMGIASVIGLGDTHFNKRALTHVLSSMTIIAAIMASSIWFELSLISFDTSSTSLEAPTSQLLLGIFAVLWCTRWQQGIYICVWAQIVASIFSELVDLLSMLASDVAQPVLRIVLSIVVCIPVYWVCRIWLRPVFVMPESRDEARQKVIFAFIVAVIFILLSNYQLIFLLIGSREHSLMIPAFRLLTGTLSLLALYLQNDIDRRQRVRTELLTMQQLWETKRSQYEISKQTIDLINRKSHDLKYHIAAFKAMNEKQIVDGAFRNIERSVSMYDSSVHTGNPALDVVFTEKSLYCESQNIALMCMVDGKQLDFIDPTDMYVIFGNALDNAIENVKGNADVNKRIIQVNVSGRGNLIVASVRNYCDTPVALIGGLPKTSKIGEAGYHGYGIRSIQYTVEQYGGAIKVDVSDNTFTLQMIFPAPMP